MRIHVGSMMIVVTLGVLSLTPCTAAGQSAPTPIKHYVDVPWADSSSESPEAAREMAAKVKAFVEAGQKPSGTPIPRTAWGQPDLSGIWQHHPRGLTTNSAQGLEPLPFTAAGLKAYNDVDKIVDPQGKCIFPGMPRLTNSANYPVQIVQLPDKVVFLYEFMHNFRIIPTDGRPHPKNFLPTLLGNSVGKWEGDTLTIDTIGLEERTQRIDDRGNVHSGELHLIERYKRISADQISYEGTLDDPTYYTKPWTYGWTWVLAPPSWTIGEYACTDGNFSLENGHQQPGSLDGAKRDGSAIAKMPATPLPR
jgi:hypothetical protein